jgi:hypothetical protein
VDPQLTQEAPAGPVGKTKRPSTLLRTRAFSIWGQACFRVQLNSFGMTSIVNATCRNLPNGGSRPLGPGRWPAPEAASPMRRSCSKHAAVGRSRCAHPVFAVACPDAVPRAELAAGSAQLRLACSALTNLLTNLLKFTSADGNVTIGRPWPGAGSGVRCVDVKDLRAALPADRCGASPEAAAVSPHSAGRQPARQPPHKLHMVFTRPPHRLSELGRFGREGSPVTRSGDPRERHEGGSGIQL